MVSEQGIMKKLQNISVDKLFSRLIYAFQSVFVSKIGTKKAVSGLLWLILFFWYLYGIRARNGVKKSKFENPPLPPVPSNAACPNWS